MSGFQHIGMHANHVARHTNNERMQSVLQWVGVGSVVMMGIAATVHLMRDLTRSHTEWKPEQPYHHKQRELLDKVNRHYESRAPGR